MKKDAHSGYERCILCRSAPSISNSHVIPKFVFRWMRKTGGTGYLRFAKTPNKRVQDGLKLALLCSSCETEIGKLENQFSSGVFFPSVDEGEIPKRTGNKEYLFLSSLHFRALGYFIKNSQDPIFYSSSEKRLILRAFSEFRQVLLKRKSNCCIGRGFVAQICV